MTYRAKSYLLTIIIFLATLFLVCGTLYFLLYQIILKDHNREPISKKDRYSSIGENSVYESGMIYFVDDRDLYKLNTENNHTEKLKDLRLKCRCIQIEGDNIILLNRKVFPARIDNFYNYSVSSNTLKLIDSYRYKLYEPEMMYFQIYEHLEILEINQRKLILENKKQSKTIMSIIGKYGDEITLKVNDNYIFQKFDDGSGYRIIYDRKKNYNYPTYISVFIFSDDAYRKSKEDEILFIADYDSLYQYDHGDINILNNPETDPVEYPINLAEDSEYYYFFCGYKSFSHMDSRIMTKIYRIEKNSYAISQIYISKPGDYSMAVALMPSYYVVYKDGVLTKYDIKNNTIIATKRIFKNGEKTFFEQTSNYIFINQNHQNIILNLDTFNELHIDN